MNENQLSPIQKNDHFQFHCHSEVPCFNHCCRDLNQALTPYDVVMLRNYLGLSWTTFKDAYAAVHIGPATGLPVVALRFDQAEDHRCPFVTAAGCRVYEARPASCRLYPLARALHRSAQTGKITEHFALLHESHCRGFEQDHSVTVRQWIADQQLAPYFEGNDAFFDLISLKTRLGKRPLPPSQQQWVMMALYDLDQLKAAVVNGRFPGVTVNGPGRIIPEGDVSVGIDQRLPGLPDGDDDLVWLAWAMAWTKLYLTDPALRDLQP